MILQSTCLIWLRSSTTRWFASWAPFFCFFCFFPLLSFAAFLSCALLCFLCSDLLYFKGHTAPWVNDLHGLLQAFRGKEAGARAEVEAFMEHCAKRWQTKEDTCQLKRRRLLPDVRD